MLAKVFVLASLFAASTLAAAVPTVTDATHDLVDMNDAIAIAEQRGIDVHGPIPSDATPIDGGFAFEADSEAAYWVRAQTALASSTTLGKREFTNIGVGMFTGSGCSGNGVFIGNVVFFQQNVAPQYFQYFSYSVSGRQPTSNEALDFSLRSGDDLCAIYKNSYRPAPGCYNLGPISCFRIIHH